MAEIHIFDFRNVPRQMLGFLQPLAPGLQNSAAGDKACLFSKRGWGESWPVSRSSDYAMHFQNRWSPTASWCKAFSRHASSPRTRPHWITSTQQWDKPTCNSSVSRPVQHSISVLFCAMNIPLNIAQKTKSACVKWQLLLFLREKIKIKKNK